MMDKEQEARIAKSSGREPHSLSFTSIRDYLNDLEALALITPLSKKFQQRFLELIDRLRAELGHENTNDTNI